MHYYEIIRGAPKAASGLSDIRVFREKTNVKPRVNTEMKAQVLIMTYTAYNKIYI